MDNIILKDMVFSGRHGVLASERLSDQPFMVSLDLKTDLGKAMQSDNLEDTIDYAKVFDLVKKCVEEKQYYLLEALSNKIIESILSQFQGVQSVTIELKKPNAPIDGHFKYFAVKITRERR